MGHRETAWILSREGDSMEIYDTSISTSERMCGSVGEELQIKMALKKAIGEQMLASSELYTCLLEVANLVNQRPIGRIPRRPWWWIVLLSKWHTAWTIIVSRATRPIQRNQESTSPSWICSEDCGLVLEAVDKGCISVVHSTKEMERRETKCSSRRLCDSPNSECNSWKLEHRSNRRRLPWTRWQSPKRQSKDYCWSVRQSRYKDCSATPRGRLRQKMRNTPSSGWSVCRWTFSFVFMS